MDSTLSWSSLRCSRRWLARDSGDTRRSVTVVLALPTLLIADDAQPLNARRAASPTTLTGTLLLRFGWRLRV